MDLAERRTHSLQFVGGLAICFAISAAWSSTAVLFYGHRGRSTALNVLLACTPVFQITAAALLWRKFRFVALGAMTFIVGEVVFVAVAWVGLLWRR